MKLNPISRADRERDRGRGTGGGAAIRAVTPGVGDSAGSVHDDSGARDSGKMLTGLSSAMHDSGMAHSTASSAYEMETWIVQEYCDLGAMNPTNVRKLMFDENGAKLVGGTWGWRGVGAAGWGVVSYGWGVVL